MAAKVKRQANSNMRRMVGLLILLAAVPITMVAVNTFRYPAPRASTESSVPNGPHFNLNIVGVPRGKTGDFSGGNRLFVPLTGQCQIRLFEGEFLVVDGNCTDGIASFQLPNTDQTSTGIALYSVWAKALGKPGGSASATTCATDTATNELFCSVYTLVQLREKGKNTFTDVSKELLSIYVDSNGDGKLDKTSIFDDKLANYYWQYDTNGLKLLQLRFYEIPTTVP